MQHFTIKLFDLDLDARDVLIAHYSKLWGRKARYSEVLRQLQREKIDALALENARNPFAPTR